MAGPKNLRELAIFLLVASALVLTLCATLEPVNSGKGADICNFEIKEVYFEEIDDPDHALFIIKGIVGPSGFHKYVINFPSQPNIAQGIGPIKVGRDEPCKEESCRPLNPCQEFITKDFIARSYPDNVPEFGKFYYGELTFYLNDGSLMTWEGDVGWKT